MNRGPAMSRNLMFYLLGSVEAGDEVVTDFWKKAPLSLGCFRFYVLGSAETLCERVTDI